MREWENTIAFVGCFTGKGDIFNGQHHSNIRAKFLEARLTWRNIGQALNL